MEEWLTPYPAAPTASNLAKLVMGCGRDLNGLQTQAMQLGDQVQALQRAEQLKAVIVDQALAAIVTSDAAGRIVEFDPSAVVMFGLSRDDALGCTVAEVMVPPRHRTAHTHGMDHIARGGNPRRMGQRLQMQAIRHGGADGANGSEAPSR